MIDNTQNNDDNSKETIHKPYSKYREMDDEGFKLNLKFDSKTVLPYLLIIFIFFMSLYLVFLIFDGVIMPSLVHNKSLVKVPDLTGMQLDKGTRELIGKNLSYKVVQEIYSEEFPVQTIVKQVPYFNNNVKEGRTIYLTVSKGKEVVAIPYLVGIPLNKARVELMKKGLELGEITYESSDFISKDTIMSQSLKAGLMVPYGSAVNIVISLGSDSQIVVPALVGLRFDEIALILNNQGFKLGELTYLSSETFTPNTVIDQNPSAGEMSSKNSYINLTISK